MELYKKALLLAGLLVQTAVFSYPSASYDKNYRQRRDKNYGTDENANTLDYLAFVESYNDL